MLSAGTSCTGLAYTSSSLPGRSKHRRTQSAYNTPAPTYVVLPNQLVPSKLWRRSARSSLHLAHVTGPSHISNTAARAALQLVQPYTHSHTLLLQQRVGHSQWHLILRQLSCTTVSMIIQHHSTTITGQHTSAPPSTAHLLAGSLPIRPHSMHTCHSIACCCMAQWLVYAM
jgi:hypothetical protein